MAALDKKQQTENLRKLGEILNKSPEDIRQLVKKYSTILGLKNKTIASPIDKNLVLNLKALLEAKERGISDEDLPKALLLWFRIRRYGDFNIRAFGSLLMELRDHLMQTKQREKSHTFAHETAENLSFFEHLTLRSTPHILDFAQVKMLVFERGLYNKVFNTTGEGLTHLFRWFKLKGDKIVMDYSTGLMWQQSGSAEPCNLKDGQRQIEHLNQIKYAGFNNWRLPTLDELACLTEPQVNEFGLYLDPIFDDKQWHIWTADLLKSLPRAWVVYFNDATIRMSLNKKSFLRSVRTAAL